MHSMALPKGLVKLANAFRLKHSESFWASLKAARRSCGCGVDGCNPARGEDVYRCVVRSAQRARIDQHTANA